MKFNVEGIDAETLAKRIMFTAWKACGGPFGMGFLQDRGSSIPEEDVIKNIQTRGDYPGCRKQEIGKMYADYVFGRMMKTTIHFSNGEIEVTPDDPQPDYQGWMRVYSSVQELVDAAVETFNDTKNKGFPEKIK
jgi:hypothetical protein